MKLQRVAKKVAILLWRVSAEVQPYDLASLAGAEHVTIDQSINDTSSKREHVTLALIPPVVTLLRLLLSDDQVLTKTTRVRKTVVHARHMSCLAHRGAPSCFFPGVQHPVE
jgi:hypothetical protein